MKAALQMGQQKNERLAGPVQSSLVPITCVYVNLGWGYEK